MEEEQKAKNGGARLGAGRKPKADAPHRIGFRCSQDVWNILQQFSNKTEFIEKAIREKYRRQNW